MAAHHDARGQPLPRKIVCAGVGARMREGMRVCICACLRAHVCVCACVRVCVRTCVCVRAGGLVVRVCGMGWKEG